MATEHTELEQALFKQLRVPDPHKPGSSLYSSHEALGALIEVSATAIYGYADDHGEGLAALLNQFQTRLYDRVAGFPHTEDFHQDEED